MRPYYRIQGVMAPLLIPGIPFIRPQAHKIPDQLQNQRVTLGPKVKFDLSDEIFRLLENPELAGRTV